LTLGVLPAATAQQLIPITSVEGFPNGRTSDNPPSYAVDGDIYTCTWTTEYGNLLEPCHLAVGFSATNVNRIRLWKTSNGGGGEDIKNIFLQYTTDDSSVPLDSRTWLNVTNVQSGHNGAELFHASAVNLDGSVTGDIHDSPSGDGWGSLSFHTVNATGMRVGFSNPDPGHFNHYQVCEFQVWFDQVFLQIGSTANRVVLWWPTNTPGFALETSSRVGTNQSWTVFPGPVLVVSDQNVVVVDPTGPSGFFRLHRP
jgi:hypothetical protein